MSAPRLAFEFLPPGIGDGASKNALAAAALAGGLDLPGLRIARQAADIEPPFGADEDRLDAGDRRALSSRLEGCLATLRPHVAVLDAIRSLGEPGALAVVTGQQPGLFASPLLSLYKALQALRVARELRARWKRPVVAIFWNHSDDHDIAEVHHAHFLNENLDLQRVGLAGMSSGRMPIGRIHLDEDRQNLAALRAVLEQSLVQRGEDDATNTRSRRALETFIPRHGETLAQTFTRAMTSLLGHQGLIVIEPDWIRERLSRALAHVIESDPVRALAAGADEVRRAGFEPAIDPASAALVYRLDERGRLALRAGGEGFRFDGEAGSRTGSELVAEIVQDLEAWSPGALLRPLAQDLCLPVAAYVGGPGELAYHAQLGALRRASGTPMTPFVPRRSCTLVTQETEQSLQRLELDVEHVLSGGLGAPDAPGTSGAPGASDLPAVLHDLHQAGERAAATLLEQRAALSAFDRSLGKNLSRTVSQVRSMIEKLVSKGERIHQNSSGKGRRHVRRLENTLLPKGLPQERVLGPLPFVARFGSDWIDGLFEALDPFDRTHLVVRFLEAPSGDGPADDPQRERA